MTSLKIGAWLVADTVNRSLKVVDKAGVMGNLLKKVSGSVLMLNVLCLVENVPYV